MEQVADQCPRDVGVGGDEYRAGHEARGPQAVVVEVPRRVHQVEEVVGEQKAAAGHLIDQGMPVHRRQGEVLRRRGLVTGGRRRVLRTLERGHFLARDQHGRSPRLAQPA